MNPISTEIVEATWQKISNLSVREGRKLAELMGQEQPIVTAYLLAVDSDTFNEEERELLFYLGLVIWQMMKQGDSSPPRVTEAMIEQAEAANVQLVESLIGATDAEHETRLAALLTTYSQPHVLRYVVEALMESDEPGEVRDEYRGIMMLDLKTVIDCLNS